MIDDIKFWEVVFASFWGFGMGFMCGFFHRRNKR